jgi:uncharacterized repeat protein (TIGR01451 family)
MHWLVLAGTMVALAGAVSRGQAPPGEIPEFGDPSSWNSPSEPPMVDGPPTQSPVPPSSPFTPPSPRAMPPDQAAPFVPGMPTPFAEPLVPPEPIVRLRVRAPSRVEPGKEIEYRLTVENISRADAHHVLVRDRLPRGVKEAVRAEPKVTEAKPTKDGLTDLLWELGTLKAGDHKTIVLAIKPEGTEDVQNRAYVQFEHGQQVTTRIAKPGVQVKVTAPTQAIKYESIVFRIEVANTGAVPLRNVVVMDQLPTSVQFGAVVKGNPEPSIESKKGQTGDKLTWKLGDLQPNQTRRLEYQAIPTEVGKVSNQVKATADGGASATGSAAVTVVEQKLKISIGGPQRRLANRPIPYHITVRNLGTAALTNVQVADELPPGGIEFLSVDGGGRREGGFVRWALGTLAPGDHRSLHLVLRAPQSGWCWNQAMVRADNNLLDKARSEVTRIETASTPVIEIDKDADSLVVGQKATYTIRLFNPGKDLQKDNVLHPSVFIAVPDEMSIQGKRGPTTAQQQGQQIHFDRLNVLEAGKEELYVVEVQAQKAGEAKLRAWWSDGRQGIGPQETWEDSTLILDPAAAANTPGPANLQVGDKEPPKTHATFRQPH